MESLNKCPALCPLDHQLFGDAKLEEMWIPQFPEPLRHPCPGPCPFLGKMSLEHPQPSGGAGSHQNLGSK